MFTKALGEQVLTLHQQDYMDVIQRFNYTRFVDDENDKLLDAIDSNDSFDADFRKKAFDDWQAYAKEQAFVIPSLYRNEVLPVHERVTGLDWSHNAKELRYDIGVSEDKR